MKARKAVILATGSGSSMLPITSIVPKELLPVCGRPVIEHVVKEAAAAGIEEVILVITKGKEAVPHYFKPNEKLKEQLEKEGHTNALKELYCIWNMVKMTTVYLEEKNETGNAILAAKKAVGNEPFAVLFADNIIHTNDCSSYTEQLITAFDTYGRSVAGVQKIDRSLASRHAIFEGKEFDHIMLNGQRVIGKSSEAETDSTLALCGRYVFKPEIFLFLEQMQSSENSKNQLVDAMQLLLESDGLLGTKLKGECYHIGDIKELLLANLSLTEFSCE